MLLLELLLSTKTLNLRATLVLAKALNGITNYKGKVEFLDAHDISKFVTVNKETMVRLLPRQNR